MKTLMTKTRILLAVTLIAGLTGCSEAFYKTGMLGLQSGQTAVCAATNVGTSPSDIHFEIRNLYGYLVKVQTFYAVPPWKTVATMQTLTGLDNNARRVVCKAHAVRADNNCLECELSGVELRVNLILQDYFGATHASTDGHAIMSLMDEDDVRDMLTEVMP